MSIDENTQDSSPPKKTMQLKRYLLSNIVNKFMDLLCTLYFFSTRWTGKRGNGLKREIVNSGLMLDAGSWILDAGYRYFARIMSPLRGL
jgi:hypothetical protein